MHSKTNYINEPRLNTETFISSLYIGKILEYKPPARIVCDLNISSAALTSKYYTKLSTTKINELIMFSEAKSLKCNFSLIDFNLVRHNTKM